MGDASKEGGCREDQRSAPCVPGPPAPRRTAILARPPEQAIRTSARQDPSASWIPTARAFGPLREAPPQEHGRLTTGTRSREDVRLHLLSILARTLAVGEDDEVSNP